MDASKISRFALIGAAALALAAVGTALWRNRPAEVPEAALAPADSPDELIARLEARLKANPDDAEGWRTLGWSFFQTRRFAEAATAYRRATMTAPEVAENWSSLGEALTLASSAGVPPDAQAAFRTALDHDPKDPRARYFLGVAKDISGDHRGAIDDWFALLRDSPAGSPWGADVRRLIVDVGKRAGIDVATRLASLKPVSGPASAAIPGPSPDQMRAASALPPGQQEAMVVQMVDGLAAKLKAEPRNPDGWIILMRSRVQLGQKREAKAALAAALFANPRAVPQLSAAAGKLGLR